MASVDDRIVRAEFDGSKFGSGIKTAMDNLDALKKGLNLDSAAKGIDDLDAAGKRFSLANVGAAAEGVSAKFIALATIGITALTNIVNKAVDAGQRIISSLTVDPIKAGLDEYELTMGSIQTILANTAKYNTNLDQVTASLDELNTYADKTIYNFGDMTKNIGLFTNAGLRVEEATSIIKGFSNESAASGVSAQGAAGAAYQLSQALSTGTIRLMDFRSLTNVGLGNKNMQQGLIEIADAMGTMSSHGTTASEVQKDFNGSLEKGWLSAEVMSNYLKIMAGDMDVATQKSLGLSDEVIQGFAKQQKTAEEAATKVRTFTQLYGTLQEAVGSGWSQSFRIIVGDFNEATDLFTNANNALGQIVSDMADARNNLLQGWSDNGGRTAAIEAVGTAFNSVMLIIKAVSQAAREIFPPITGKQLADMTKNVRDFVVSLKPSADVLNDLKRTAAGAFAVLDIGWQIIKRLGGVLFDLLGFAGQGSSGILDFTGNIGDFLVKVDKAIKSGEGLNNFFDGLKTVLKVPITIIKEFIGFVGDMFGALGDIGTEGFDSAMSTVTSRFQGLLDIGQRVQDFFGFLGGVFKGVFGTFAPIISAISDLFQNLGTAISDSLTTQDFNSVLDLINTGLLAGIGALIYKFVTGFKKNLEDLVPGKGITASIKEVFGGLTDTLGAMQAKLKAQTLLTIAGAVGILTLSVIGLSLIDPAKLATALTAITIMFVQLGAAMAVFNKAFSIADGAKLVLIGAALITLSTGILILSAAAKVFSTMSWDEIARGSVAMAAAVGIMVGAMVILGGVGPAALLGSAALTVASVGILIISAALKVFATLSWDDIGRAMTTLGGTMAILAVGLTLMAGALPGAAALTIASVGILVISAALKVFSTLTWDDIGRAMTTLGGTLAILAVGLTLMIAALPGAAALVVASGALVVVAGALKIFATMDWDNIGKAMVVLGGTLGILAVGLNLMTSAIPGALALLIAAASLAVLAPILVVLGSLSWDSIGRGLTVLAASLAILAIAGVALQPAIPGLVGLGVAIALIGVGILAAGAGLALFAVGLATLATVGTVASAVIVAAILAIASTIPTVATAIGEGILNIATVIANGGSQILAALTTIILAILQAVIDLAPKFGEAATVLIQTLLNVLTVLLPDIVNAGMKIIVGILDGIAKRIDNVVDKGVAVVVAFLDGVGRNSKKLADAAFKLVIDFMNGIADSIRDNADKVRKAGANIADAIIDGITGGITSGASRALKAASNMATNVLNAAKKALGIASPSKEFTEVGMFSTMGLAKGLNDYSGYATKASAQLGTDTVMTLKKSLSAVPNVMSQFDFTPQIRPVLDLSAVKKDAGLISGIVGDQRVLDVSTSGQSAQYVAKQNQENADAQEAMAGDSGNKYYYNQTISSPKPISEAEVYRNSKNLLSVTKEALEANAE